MIVDFLEGDPDRPIITGRVYNAEQMPPYDLPANKTQSGMKSRSSLGGGPDNYNEIRFEDKKGSEQLFIHAEKNQDIEVENDETHWVGHDRKKTIDHDETTHVKHDRTETVDKNETITVHGERAPRRSTRTRRSRSTRTGRRRSTRTRRSSIGGELGRSRSRKSETATVALQRTHTVGINETITVGAAQEITVGGGAGDHRRCRAGDQRRRVADDHVGRRSIDQRRRRARSINVGGSQTVNVGKNGSMSDRGRRVPDRDG